MADTPTNGGSYYRIQALEHALERLQDRVDTRLNASAADRAEINKSLAVLATEYRTFARDTEARLRDLEASVEKDVKGLRRLLITFSLTVAGSATAFAITTIVYFGGPS